MILRHEVPAEVSPDEPVVRSLHEPYHFEDNPRRVRPDALIGAKKYRYDCSVTRLAYSSWESCKKTAHKADSNDPSKSYLKMMLICVSAAREAGIEVLHKPTMDNPAHACLHFGNDAKEERNNKARLLINAAIRGKGAFVLDDPAPQAPDWRGPSEEDICARCRRA